MCLFINSLLTDKNGIKMEWKLWSLLSIIISFTLMLILRKKGYFNKRK